MTRVKRFAASMISGYAAMGANVIYTLVSIPLALHYLDKEQFGLWALVMQIGGYLALVDLGMSPAVARILGDHKDDPDGGDYGSVIKTSLVVAAAQSMIILLLGAVLTPVLVEVMAIPGPLKHNFVLLLLGQAVLQAVLMISRPIGAPLWCHQRQDVTNYCNIGLFAVLLLILWGGFKSGLGIWTMLLGGACGALYSLVISSVVVYRLGLLPKAGHWGRVDRARFTEIFGFGRDVFLMALGSQLVSASQIIVISRFLGLEAAAAWSVGTKMFTLVQQMVWRFCDFSAPVLTEMFVREEMDRFRHRFQDLVVVTAALAAFVSVMGILFNSDFVFFWTHGKVEWPHHYDVMLGLLLFVGSVTRCHTGLVGITKQIRGMRYVYLLEGVLFVFAAVLSLNRFGIAGVITSSILANILCSGLYGTWRSSLLFKSSITEIAFGWISRPLIFFGSMAIISLIAFQATAKMDSALRLILEGVIVSSLAFFLLWNVGMPPGLKNELKKKLRVFLKI